MATIETTRITQQQLESYLWGAATLLRGTIDAGDYKQYIFPLLFFKRVCDVFDEETSAALKESGGDQAYALFPEQHRFQVPAAAHWREVRKITTHVGQAIQKAMRGIETANQEMLLGIFGDAQWTNKDRLSDEMLRDLVEHFSSLNLSVANLPEDELGNGYEYLIKKFADDSGHTAAEFYTNRTVVHLMTELLEPQPGESIYDPTCGTGGMLLSAIAHLRRQGKEWRSVKLYGQERNLMTSSIARMNCFLHGSENFRIERGDTLSEPKFHAKDGLKTFDVVLANPPYSIKAWDRAAFASDPWGRNLFGVPPQGRADYAFQQHIFKSMDSTTGRCAVLWPHGILFRDAENEIRHKVIEADLIEAVIGLGPNLFYNSSMPSCVLICRMKKPKARRGKILLVNAVSEVMREGNQSYLNEENILRIVDVYKNFKEIDEFSKIVKVEDILDKGGSLNLTLYVAAPSENRDYELDKKYSIKNAVESWLNSGKFTSEALRSVIGPSLMGLPDYCRLSFKDSALLNGKENWEKVSLGNLLDKTEIIERNPVDVGLERYLLVDHMDAGSLRIKRWGDISDGNLPPTFYKVFNSGQILYPTRNPHLRRAAYAEFDGICGEKTLTLSARECVDARFLAWVFQTDDFVRFATTQKIGSTNPHVRWRDVASFQFHLPPLDQQRRISDILWALDECICRFEESASRAKTWSLLYLREVFSSNDPNILRPVRETGIVQLGRQRAPKYQTGEFTKPYLRVANVFDDFIDYSDILEMDFSDKDFKSYYLIDGDILLNEGQSRELVGRCAIFRNQDKDYCFQNTLIRYRAGSNITTEYAFAYFQYCFHTGIFASISSQTTSIAHLGADRFGGLLMPVPSIESQNEVTQKFSDLKAIEKGLRDRIVKYKSLAYTIINEILP